MRLVRTEERVPPASRARVRTRRVATFAAIASTCTAIFASAPASADPASALSAARERHCHHGATLPPLRPSSALDAAAAAMARGETLHDALERLPVRPASATSFHIVGGDGDADLARMAAARFCLNLSDPTLRDIGYARTHGQLWVIMTAPLAAPDPADRHSIETEVLRGVNRAREHGQRCGMRQYAAVPPLHASPVLTEVAWRRSQAMAAEDRFDHVARDGSTPAERVGRAGYAAQLVGENIAAGVPTAREVVAGWLASEGHCRNIMEPRFSEMGVSFAVAARSAAGIYWTQLLAKPR